MGIGGVDAIDLFSLSRAEGFVGIQAPDTFQEALPPQDLLQSRDATGEIVIITGVERDVSPGFGDGADDIQRLVTVEWRNLDGDNIFNLGELAPEFVGKYAAAHGRLQVKTNERYDLRHFSGVSYERRVLRIFHGGQAQQARAVSQTREQLRFCDGLRCRSADTSDAD